MKRKIIDTCQQIAEKQNRPKKHPEYGRHHHWSFVVQGNKIIEIGNNRAGKNEYSGFGYRKSSKIHSEHHAYEKAKGLLDRRKSFEIVNIRLNKQGDLRLSKPCVCCFRFLKFIECKTVWFSTEAGFASIKL